jgi:uncharacterized protein (TIGR02611 family)
MAGAAEQEQTGAPRPLRGLAAFRARVRRTRAGRIGWRIVVTILGVAMVAVGIVLLPLPGPGWVIIFAGLGLLATEYEWAARLLRYARDQLTRWTHWLQARSRPVQLIVGLGFVVLVAALLYAAWYVYLR